MKTDPPTDAPSGLRDAACSPSDYDAGLLSDFGGGDVGWWQDYIRAEIGRANEYWRDIHLQQIHAEYNLQNENERMKAGLLSIRDRVRNSQTQTTTLMKIGMIAEISLEKSDVEGDDDNE
jgi:hypothetical protein